MFVLSEMDKLNIQSLIIEMQKQQVQLQQLQTFILQESFQRQIPEYVSLKEAAQLKGVTSYENLQKKPWHQPCCGTRIVRLNGHRCWKRQDMGPPTNCTYPPPVDSTFCNYF